MRASVLLLLWTASAMAAPARYADAPGGRITLVQPEVIDARKQLALSLARRHEVQTFRMIADTEGSRSWFRFSAAWDTVTFWPAGQTIVATLRDGRQVEALDLILCGPPREARPLRLGQVARFVDPSEVEHDWHGRPGVLLFVSFPDPGLALRDIAGVQVRGKQKTGFAAPTPQQEVER